MNPIFYSYLNFHIELQINMKYNKMGCVDTLFRATSHRKGNSNEIVHLCKTYIHVEVTNLYALSLIMKTQSLLIFQHIDAYFFNVDMLALRVKFYKLWRFLWVFLRLHSYTSNVLCLRYIGMIELSISLLSCNITSDT